MDFITDTRALMIVKQLLDNTSTVKPILNPTPQKPKFAPSAIQKPFARSLPESQGVSSLQVSAFLNALKDDPCVESHSVEVDGTTKKAILLRPKH